MKKEKRLFRRITEYSVICFGENCFTRMFLSKEGYRCLRCPGVFCRKCAASHFSELEHLADAAIARSALKGRNGLTIMFSGPPPKSFVIEAKKNAKLRREGKL